MFNERLRKKREETGISQRQFAIKIGFSADLYNKYEQGVSRPSNETLVLLAKSLNCTTDYLLGNADDPTPPGQKATPADKTPADIAIEYFRAVNGREPSEIELLTFISVTEGLFRTFPGKKDSETAAEIAPPKDDWKRGLTEEEAVEAVRRRYADYRKGTA